MSAPAFAVGMRPLVGLAARRDRTMVGSWLAAIVFSVLLTALSYASLYPTEAERASFAAGAEATGATRALYGVVYDDSVGGLVAWRLLATGGLLVGIFVALLVVRHSRADEQTGRVELVAAGTVDRAAPLAAATAIALCALAALCVLSALSLMATGEDPAGSLAFGAAWLGLGATIIGIATIAVQVSASARACRGIAIGTAAGLFAVRMIGDSTSASWLSWCTPFGWAQQVRPFGGNRWWVLLLPLAASLALGAAGFALHARRDLGAGLLPQRAGPPRGGRLLRGRIGLAVRLNRAALLGWVVGLALYGAVIGSIATSVTDFTAGNQATEDVIAKLGGAGSLIDSFLGAGMSFCGMGAAAYAVTVVLRARDDETSGLQELAMASRISRRMWLGALIGFAALGAAVVLGAAAVAAGVLRAARGESAESAIREAGAVVAGAMTQLPATWLVAALCALGFGWVPRWSTAVGWGSIAAFAVISLLGPLVNAPQWVMDLSPFTHLPATPHAPFPTTAFLIIAVLAVLGAVAALIGYRRRNLGTG